MRYSVSNSGPSWLGVRSGACDVTEDCGPAAPIQRTTVLLGVAVGGGSLMGATRESAYSGAIMFRMRFGVRSAPFGGGAGMALEVALNTGMFGGFAGETQDPALANEEGVMKVHMGGDMRLFFRARARLQPYLQLGAAYMIVDQGERESISGGGVLAGGGMLYWLSPNFAVDLGLRYDVARLDGRRTVQALGLGLGIKLYI